MPGELLLDTGALVSLLDRSQTHHADCTDFFDSWSGPIVSTEAVLTEATHLLGRVHGGRRACLEFFLLGGAVLFLQKANQAAQERARAAEAEQKLAETEAKKPMIPLRKTDACRFFGGDTRQKMLASDRLAKDRSRRRCR